MIIEILADGGSSVGQVFKTLWSDAVGAFAGDFRDKKIVDRATLTGPVLAGLAWAIIGILPICALIVLLMVKEPPPIAGETRPKISDGLKLVMKNGPMLRVLAIVLLVHFGESFRNAVSLFFIRDIVGVPTIGAAYFFYFIAGLGAIPFWLWLGQLTKAFMWTLITVASVTVQTYFLATALHFLFAVYRQSFCFGGLQFLPIAMLADVVDVDSARSGGQRAGAYFAFLSFSEKSPSPSAPSAAEHCWPVGLRSCWRRCRRYEAGVFPADGLLFGSHLFLRSTMKLIWSYPLTPERHGGCGKLARRNARLAAKDSRQPDRNGHQSSPRIPAATGQSPVIYRLWRRGNLHRPNFVQHLESRHTHRPARIMNNVCNRSFQLFSGHPDILCAHKVQTHFRFSIQRDKRHAGYKRTVLQTQIVTLPNIPKQVLNRVLGK